MESAQIDRAAKVILATRAPGLSRQEWARKAAEAVLAPTPRPRAAPSRRDGVARATRETPVIVIRKRACPGWIGTFDDGSLRIGVTEDTEAETREALDAAVVRWREIASLPLT